MPFKPGQSGNPTGRKKSNPEFLKALKKLVPRALEIMQHQMEHALYASDRIKAATWILERAEGKAIQALELSGKDGASITPVIEIVARNKN